MGAFKKFIEELKISQNQKLLAEDDKNNAIAAVRSELPDISDVSDVEKDKFSEEIISFSTSNEFVDLLDKKLAPPLPGESKQMFVERGLDLIRKIMLDKMD